MHTGALDDKKLHQFALRLGDAPYAVYVSKYFDPSVE